MEIEKKYLINELPSNLNTFKKEEMKQGYVSTDPVIRIRQSDDKCVLTVKGPGKTVREEFELTISITQFESLWNKVDTNAVYKTRYYIPIENELTAELDIYKGKLEGLYTVEVEFDTVDEMNAFIPPYWFGADVSDDKRYKNTSLSLNGLPK